MSIGKWDAGLYDAKHGFVSAKAKELLAQLAPQLGERILDLGCGTGTLTSQIAASGASIKQVVHDRAFAGSDVSAVHVLCTVETRNREQLAMLRRKLREHGVETYDSR